MRLCELLAARRALLVIDMVAAMAQFAIVAGLMTLVPGIDFTFVLRTALTHSKTVAFAAVLGISSGLILWAVAAAAGLTALLAASEMAFTALRFGGALYMIYLGAVFIIKSNDHRMSGELASEGSVSTAFRRGLLTNLLNPKIGVFYLAVLPPFLPTDTNTVLAAFLLALVHVAEGLIYFTFVIAAASFFKRQLEKPHLRAFVDRFAGVLIIGFGVRLLASSSNA